MINIDKVIKYSQTLKLLYVEDNKEARESTTLILEEFFNDIIVAVNGEDGYEKFIENKDSINLIITDINMPKLNGLEMTAKIREKSPYLSILILSAYNESDFFIDSIKLGVDGYLLKPINIDQFINILSIVTSKVKLQYENRKSTHLLEQYKQITDKSSIISILDTNNIITYVNDSFCEISNYTKEDLIGKDYHSLLKYKQPKEIHHEIWDTIQNKKEIWQGILKFVSNLNKTYYLKTTIKPILDENNNIIEYISLRDDVTKIMDPKKQLEDAISNLQHPLIVYMKLEEFSTLAEIHGYTTIEEIQDKITSYLEHHMPANCRFNKIYQLGNGEYAMINEKNICILNNNVNGLIDNLKIYQENIRKCLVNIIDLNYDVSIIMSLAYHSDKVLESSKVGIQKLLQNKQDFIISNNFAQIEQSKAKKNMKTISMVKKAINEFNIISHFQPIINNKTKEIEKYESLVRLVDEDNNILSPFLFLDTAKQGKYYSSITDMVLNNSFSALQNTDMDISINLSALDIELKSTRDKIFELLNQNKQYAHRIIIELLEDENIKDFDTIKTFIIDVKKLGIKIAIDDFGAGYSSFERLLDYQPDILKIDGCLVKDIETNNYSLSVVETIVAFAKKQNIQTIAEYVENENIFNILKDLGVDYSQGYYFGKPEPLQNYNYIKDEEVK